MRTPTAIYPFTSELLPLVKYFKRLQEQFSIARLISLPGFGLSGKDAAYSCNHSETGYIVTEELDMEDPAWETLAISRPLNPDVISDEKLLGTINQALNAGKKVMYFDTGVKDVPKPMWELAGRWPDKLEVYSEDSHPTEKISIDEYYCMLNTPAVLVGGLAAEADTFEVLTGMASNLREKGLCPLVISRQPLGKLFGFHSISHILKRFDKSEAEKITEINLVLRDLEHTYLPDVILMEAPDPVMRYNNIAPNGFGIQSYMLCQAAPPDYFICCVPCDLAVGGFLKMLSEDFSNRLGTSINAAHVSNIIVDSADVLQSHKVSYVRVSMNTVYEKIEKEGPQSEIPMFNAAAEKGAKSLSSCLFSL